MIVANRLRVLLSGTALAAALFATSAAEAGPGKFLPFFGPKDAPGNSGDKNGDGSPSSSGSATAQSGIVPYYGNINAFYGNINAFYGNINAFSGNLSPFYGNINAFWGNINAFYGNINAFWGNINAFYGNINAFANGTTTADGFVKPAWGNINAFWNTQGAAFIQLNTAWATLPTTGSSPATGTPPPPPAPGPAPAPGAIAADPSVVLGQLQAFVGASRSFWGAAVQSQSGKSFDDAITTPLLAKYGLDLNDPNSLLSANEVTRQRFMLDWYDALMNFSGSDRVDWWMKTADWTPNVTIAQGAGSRTTIGLLDFSIQGDSTVNQRVVKYDGVSTFSNGHGNAVASLITSPMDGKGIMGIAPMASVIAYNPFDATATAGWQDITNGVNMLVSNGATVINMSLGVPGWTLNQGWNDVFTSGGLQSAAKNSIFVIAAGNNSISQTQDIVWDKNNPNIIVVGSIDPTGTISSFSNQPGTACLLDGNKCPPNGKLMNRFIVAPGELLLVSDGNGGTVRMSGTSFAAPLVSGTVALLQNRWPWLVNYPAASVGIILGTARDLGAPGVDPVYGVGALDITAAMSPLDFKKLQWFSPTAATNTPLTTLTASLSNAIPVKGIPTSATAMGAVATPAKTVQQPSNLAKWEAGGVYFYAFEPVPGTFRDFAIPLSTRLFGQSVKSADGTQQILQDYLYSRAVGWINGTNNFASSGSGFGFASFTERGGAVGSTGSYQLTMSMAPKTRVYGYRQSAVPYQTAVRLASADGRTGFRMGFGDGAVALGGEGAFGLVSDYDAESGGANPLLGMASGGAYGNVDMAVTRELTVSAGFSERRLRRDNRLLGPHDLGVIGGQEQRAGASHVAIHYRPTGALTLNASLTHVLEDQAVLGIRSLDPNDLGAGAATDGVTLGADLDLGRGLSIAASATRARTLDRSGGAHNLAIADGGLTSSAYAVAFGKARVLDSGDRLRLTVSQPMHVEHGAFDFTSVQVVDRMTGELGVVTQRFDTPTPARQLIGELLYARPLGARGEISLFGRAQLRQDATPDGTPRLLAGTRYAVSF